MIFRTVKRGGVVQKRFLKKVGRAPLGPSPKSAHERVRCRVEHEKISEEGPMMFRSCSNTSRYFLRDYVTIAIVIILVTMATPISSHVKDKNSIFTACDEDMIF